LETGSETAPLPHPDAVHHLPPFISMPGTTDWFLVGTGIFLLLVIVAIGVFYLKLHALPEHMAHRGQKVQYEIVAVLALISLFTHNHAFWIVGLLLALIPIPDISTPLSSMAQSLGRMARRDGGDPAVATLPGEPAPPAADRPQGAGTDHV
jgi:hypothetical protein